MSMQNHGGLEAWKKIFLYIFAENIFFQRLGKKSHTWCVALIRAYSAGVVGAVSSVVASVCVGCSVGAVGVVNLPT